MNVLVTGIDGYIGSLLAPVLDRAGHAVPRGLSRIRGVECNSPTGFADAFYGRKVLLG